MLVEDVGFSEGPVVTEQGDVVFTSIDQGTVFRVAQLGVAAVVATTGGGPNGACAGAGGEVFLAQNGGNWMVGRERGGTPPAPAEAGVQRIARNGALSHVTTSPLAPNDLCFGPDGLLYVTDPTRRRTYDDGRIWRVDPTTGDAHLLYQLDWFPNGIAFGLDDDVIYVASTGDQQIVRLPIAPSTPTETGEVVIEMDFGHPDGIGFDVEGNLLVCALSRTDAPGQIQTWTTNGKLLDRFSPGPNAKYTNLALSGDGALVVTDSDGGRVLIVDDWPTAGLALFPHRHERTLAPPLGRSLLGS